MFFIIIENRKALKSISISKAVTRAYDKLHKKPVDRKATGMRTNGVEGKKQRSDEITKKLMFA